MSEEQKAEAPLKSETLKYLGKKLAPGKNEGVGQKGAWKRFTLEFESGGLYSWKCSAFDPMSPKGVQPTAMVEGNFYDIVFKEQSYIHPEYGPKMSKSAVLIKEATADKATHPGQRAQSPAPAQAQAAPAAPLTMPFNEDSWAVFESMYGEKTKGSSDANAMHMLGVYVANFAPDYCKAAIEKCRAHFNKAQTAPAQLVTK